MKLNVRLFAQARDLVGAECVEVTLSAEATVADLRTELANQLPELSLIARNLLIAVGVDYAADQTVLHSDDDVACFPPVSGG